MVSFFCLTTRWRDITLSAVIVSGIAKKLGSNQTLFVRAVPSFASQYPDITFSTQLPTVLMKYRRSVHEDVIFDGDAILINTWLHQLRDTFTGDGLENTMLGITKNCMTALGLRKRISMSYILESSADSIPKSLSTHRKALVCLTPQICNDIDDSFVYQIMSSNSTLDFVINTKLDFKPNNCHYIEYTTEFARYMKGSDAVITTEQFTLFPFFNIVKGKKIFLTAEPLVDIFKDVKIFGPTHDLITNLIKDLRCLTT